MRIILLGKQGSGKGTCAEFLCEKLKVPHISTGERFRELSQEGSELGNKIKNLIDAGNLVPDDVTINVLKDRLSKDDCKKGFILDGFPRNLDQAHVLEEVTDLDLVFVLNISDETAVKRLTSRRQCRGCLKIYNLITNPPKEDGKCSCGGELYQREDDKEEFIKKRLEIYKQEEEDLIEFYHAIIRTVDAEKPSSEIFKTLERFLSEFK
ncbi:MAG: nucleoside monophosphate kinase [Candidatus Nanoarchaeia archaeon]|nr:nucleoside monophosphate kinase [Candidatus Nanoarchaeia archaeon]